MSTVAPHSQAETESAFDYKALQNSTQLGGFGGYSVADQALRKSCDRCYSQKLKCSKNVSSTSGCIRCANAGLRCIYSSRRPRRVQKRSRSWDKESDEDSNQMIRRFTSRPVGSQILPSSPIPEVRGLLDPLPLTYFDLASQGLVNSTYTDQFNPEYTWPPKGWPGEPHPRGGLGTVSMGTQGITAPFQEMGRQERTGADIEYSSKPMMGQSMSLDELASLSRQMEDYHDKMCLAEPLDDLQHYPIGETLEYSKQLLDILRTDKSLWLLRDHSPDLGNLGADKTPSRSRTTNLMVALQCYILCVKLLARFCQTLLAQPAVVAEHEAQVVRQDPSLAPHRKTDPFLPTQEEEPQKLTDKAIAIPLHSDLLLGQLHSHLDPFGHLLNCACDALNAGCKYLRAIEAILGIPITLGVLQESLSTQKAYETNISTPAGVRPTRVRPATSMPIMGRSVSNGTKYVHIQAKGNVGDDQPLLHRLLTVLWDEETRFEWSTSPQETAVEVVRRCRKQIYNLADQRAAYSDS